ncbi:hypothetical protein PanWU01x14_060510, partial [Parasponia andersonii]
MANNNTDIINDDNMISSQQLTMVPIVSVPTMARGPNFLMTPMVPVAHHGEKPEKFCHDRKSNAMIF